MLLYKDMQFKTIYAIMDPTIYMSNKSKILEQYTPTKSLHKVCYLN